MPHIRPAGLADAVQIARVHVRSWQAAYRGMMPQDFLDGLDPAYRAERWRSALADADPTRRGLLVATPGSGDIIGFASFGPSRDSDTEPQVTGEVYAIYADPDAWGTGAGRALMAGVVAQLARMGYTDAVLWVLEANDRARRFYTLAGWVEDGARRIDDSYGFDVAEVRYRRALA